MRRFLLRVSLVSLLAAPVCLAQVGPAQRPMPPTAVAPAHPAKAEPSETTARAQTTAVSKTAATKKAKGKKAQAAPEEQLPLPRPPTPEQLPATRPTVSYRNGQLSIVANNSTMADVLNQVKQQTGAQFEMTGVSAADRVYAKLGPGAPKDVLAALLDGTRFNFAILGSASDPAAVARVVLMPRAAGGAGGTSGAANPQPAYRQPQPLPEEENPEEEMPVVEEEPPPPVEEQPSEQNPQQQPGQVKTPEQLLQELQQMQQQQQQNQQQNPPQQQIPDREIPD